jgi:hypothetical protein
MPILTKPSVTKGTPAQFALSKSDLKNHPAITDVFFQNDANWKTVSIQYKNVEGQKKTLVFDAKQPSPVKNFLASEGARSDFQVQSVTIFDEDGGSYTIERSELNSADFDVIFASSESGSWFNMYAQGGNNRTLAFNYDKTELYVGSPDRTAIEPKAFFAVGVEASDGSVNEDISNLIDFRVNAYDINSDQTKLYVAGGFGFSYQGTVLPPLTVGPNYGTSPSGVPRVLMIDVETSEVTWLFDVETVGAKSAFGGFEGSFYRLLIDESLDVAICYGQGMISAYAISTGSSLWSKSATSPTSSTYQGFQDARKMVSFGNDFIVKASAYDGQTLPFVRPLRISKLTGLDTNLLPSPTTFTFSTDDCGFSISPDSSKIVVSTRVSNAPGFAYYDGSDWIGPVLISGLSITGGSSQIVAENDYIILGASGSRFDNSATLHKSDYDGVRDTSFQLPATSVASFGRAEMAIINESLYALARYVPPYVSNGRFGSSLVKIDVATGTISGAFKGAVGNDSQIKILSAVGERIYCYRNQTGTPTNTIKSLPLSNLFFNSATMVIVDAEAASLKDILTGGSYSEIGSLSQTNNLPVMSSALYPDLLLYVSNEYSSGGIRAYNKTTETYESGWPVTTEGLIAGSFQDENFIYLIAFGIVPASNGLRMSDSNGPFTPVGDLIRVSLDTKTIDRSFQVQTGAGSGTISNNGYAMSATEDYIYLSVTDAGGGTGDYSGPVLRVKKDDSSVQSITPATLGLSKFPRSVQFFRMGLNFAKIGENKLVCYMGGEKIVSVSSNSTSLDGKPYILITEDTLEQSYSQPSNASANNVRVIVNTETRELAGLTMESFGQSRFTTYNLDTNVKTDSDLINGTGSDIFFNVTNNDQAVALAFKGSDYYMYFGLGSQQGDDALVYKGRPYIGVVRMNPMGIPVE